MGHPRSPSVAFGVEFHVNAWVSISNLAEPEAVPGDTVIFSSLYHFDENVEVEDGAHLGKRKLKSGAL